MTTMLIERTETTEKKQIVPSTLDTTTERMAPASLDGLRELNEGIARSVATESIDEAAPSVRVCIAGRVVDARPIDNKRFLRAMSAHVCLN